jgi:HEAT repeat protein
MNMKDLSGQIKKLNSFLPWVRMGALNSLVEAGLPAVKAILAALDTPYAPIGIKSVSSNQSPEFIAQADASGRWRWLVDALVNIGKPALPELENALHHANLNVRISAMHAIGRIGDPSAADLLLPFLQSEKPHERAWALGSLGYTRSPRVFEILVSALDDRSMDIKETAIRALGEFGDTRALPKLERIAEKDRTMIENYGLTIAGVAKDAIRKIHEKSARK